MVGEDSGDWAGLLDLILVSICSRVELFQVSLTSPPHILSGDGQFLPVCEFMDLLSLDS